METNKTPEETLANYIDLARKEYPNQNWMSNKEMLESPENRFMIMAMEEYGKQQYNQAIKDASETCNDQLINYATAKAIKHSILKLLKE